MSWSVPVLIQILIVGFAAHGLQRFITTDAFFKWFRVLLAKWGWIHQGVIIERERPGVNGAVGRWAWKLCTCPFCFGAWCCLLLWVLSDQEFWRPVVAVLAVRGLQCVVSAALDPKTVD